MLSNELPSNYYLIPAKWMNQFLFLYGTESHREQQKHSDEKKDSNPSEDNDEKKDLNSSKNDSEEGDHVRNTSKSKKISNIDNSTLLATEGGGSFFSGVEIRAG